VTRPGSAAVSAAAGTTIAAALRVPPLPAQPRFGMLTMRSQGARMESAQPSPSSAQAGSTDGSENSRLFAALYSDLRDLAERQLRRNAGASISPTTLLHEAYLGISGREAVFPDQARFMGYAARVMRGVIIDFVRERRAFKRGAAFQITQLPTEVGEHAAGEAELSRLSEALDELATHDPRLAEVVDLRYFCGKTFDDIAAQRGTSKRTVQRDWEKARVLLFQQLTAAP
jgi:RNA polymerase sigma factor (TIGR02999 family)